MLIPNRSLSIRSNWSDALEVPNWPERCEKQVFYSKNVDFSFSVEQRDINAHDLIHKKQALPRYDCNQFPFGQASMGLKRAEMMANS